MNPYHRIRGEKVGLAFRDGMSALALELSQTPDATLRSATARAQGTGLAATRASSQSSGSNTGRSLASAEVKGRHRIMAELKERRSG